MKRLFVLFSLLACWLTLAIGCKKNDSEPQTELRFVVPSNFPEAVYKFENNTVGQAGFELGRHLFFEDALSIDNSVNCGTCHQQFAAFANLDHSVSHGVNDCFGTRNAPPLFNLAWQKEFMWDGGVNHIEVSGLNALVDPCEMANSLDNITSTLSKKQPYPDLFKKAFGTPEINSQRIFRALTQFTAMMVSATSKYDKHIRKEVGGEFTAAEQAGYILFRDKCSKCHSEPLFTDLSYRSNGLDQDPKENGREKISRQASDQGKFKVPSLRNVELTRPYMHDGRFFSLEDVLEHYNSGVMDHINLDPELKKDPVRGIALSKTEQQQIISFLKTLTDNEFIRDKRFAEL
ncbi:cytochrome c peroxidase [Daejeonella sp. JGW-45]|uniref:cytochrome-c peroxidase n=1 Tax=Daejeonella sp. JGW-45 TaxID=3034148 RepID=UPI0023EB4360|nr:cytochrome c peroxidase [Daejeonella sp. JGW-45]